MKAYRVMGNDLHRGTWVHKDVIGTERMARSIMKAMRKTNPDQNFFVQEYEEARAGHNKLSEHST
jgi:hypothetical protein